MQQWALQDAKARLSELVRLAAEHEPQAITLRGEPAVVVLSAEDYCRLVKPKPSLVELTRSSPLMNTEFDLARDQSLTRDIDLSAAAFCPTPTPSLSFSANSTGLSVLAFLGSRAAQMPPHAGFDIQTCP